MADPRLRELERRWSETGAAEDEAALLGERLRQGAQTSESLRKAAALGHPAACIVTGIALDPLDRRRTPWHDAARAALAERLLYGAHVPLPTPGAPDVAGLQRGGQGQGPRSIRALYEALLTCEAHPFQTILGPWLLSYADAERIPSRLRSLTSPAGPYQATNRELWMLYAISRLNDVLLLAFQADADHAWTGASVTLSEYVYAFQRLGFTLDVSETFHPFHHEVVEVDPADDPDEPITLVDCLWPGLSFGQLRFSRAGVRVRGGARWIVKAVAETSPLYFTFRRLRRPTSDSSHGWGSNSQWRTAFRRDYEEPDAYHYNVDGRWLIGEELPPDERDLAARPPAERREHLRHRCALRVAEAEDQEPWPFDDRWVEPKLGPA